jgi:hypothetical protein
MLRKASRRQCHGVSRVHLRSWELVGQLPDKPRNFCPSVPPFCAQHDSGYVREKRLSATSLQCL